MPTLPKRVYETVNKNPHKKALGYKKGSGWFYYTYSEYWQKVEKAAYVLQQKGINEGDRVAILSENRPEWAMVDQAVMLIGAIVVPLHTTLSAKYIKYILQDSGAKLLFISNGQLFEKSKDAIADLQNLQRIVLFENLETEYSGKNLTYFSDWQIGSDKYRGQMPKDDEKIATIIYTSGTTGEPKGVMLSHKNIVSNVEAAMRHVPVKNSDVFLSFLPLSHVLERSAGYYAPFFVGATICYVENIENLADNIVEVKPTILISVPRIFERVYEKIKNTVNHEDSFKKKIFYWSMDRPKNGLGHFLADRLVYKKIRKRLGGRIRFAISGGASLNEKVARFFEKIGIIVLEGYGLTETSPVISCNKLDNYKFGSVGLPLDNLAVKIMPDKEIAVRGPSIMKGYFNRDDLTDEALSRDGWLLTGDLGFIDQAGFLTIIGRKKEMISLSNGKTIAPEKIEGFITISKYVAQALVIGHKKPYLSALIVPDWHNLIEYARCVGIDSVYYKDLAVNQKIIDFLYQQIENETRDLPDYEKIKKFIIVEDEFTQELGELTPTLKLRRDVITYNYRKEIDKLYFVG